MVILLTCQNRGNGIGGELWCRSQFVLSVILWVSDASVADLRVSISYEWTKFPPKTIEFIGVYCNEMRNGARLRNTYYGMNIASRNDPASQQ